MSMMRERDSLRQYHEVSIGGRRLAYVVTCFVEVALWVEGLSQLHVSPNLMILEGVVSCRECFALECSCTTATLIFLAVRVMVLWCGRSVGSRSGGRGVHRCS